MQKLDLRNNLHQLIIGLKSKEIVKILEGNLKGNDLLKLVVNSKAAYDKASTNKDMIKVFEQFNLSEIYSINIFSHIISFVSNLGIQPKARTQFLNDSSLTTFYSHHKTLIATFNIVDNLLLEDIDFFDENRSFNISQAQDKGNLILQIIDEGNVPLDKMQSIIIHLNKLIETIYLLYDKIENENFTDKPSIIMVSVSVLKNFTGLSSLERILICGCIQLGDRFNN